MRPAHKPDEPIEPVAADREPPGHRSSRASQSVRASQSARAHGPRSEPPDPTPEASGTSSSAERAGQRHRSKHSRVGRRVGPSYLRLANIDRAVAYGELVVFFAVGIAAASLHRDVGASTAMSVFVSVATLLFAWIGDHRRPTEPGQASSPELFARLARSLAITFALVGASAFMLEFTDPGSRRWLALWFLAAAATLAAYRLIVAQIVRRAIGAGRLRRRVALYGSSADTAAVWAHLQTHGDAGTALAGCYEVVDPPAASPLDGVTGTADDAGGGTLSAGAGLLNTGPDTGRGEGEGDGIGWQASASASPSLFSSRHHDEPSGEAGLDALERAVASGQVEEVVIAVPFSASRRIAAATERLSRYAVAVRVAPDLSLWRAFGRPCEVIGGVPMVRALDAPIEGWPGIVKFFEDRLLAAALLLALSPLLGLIALAVKLDSPGRVFFRQPRRGWNGGIFTIYKFRTMRDEKGDPDGAIQAVRGDARITRVGAFLRRTSLDELPQLLNVVFGDMSLVGPRPHALGTLAGGRPFEQVVADYMRRYRVKPGLTGWAQVNGWRGETDTDEKLIQRVRYDIEYIEHWTLWLDLYILAITPLSLFFRSDNAY